MGRLYTIPLSSLTVTNDSSQDIWTLTASASGPCTLHGFSLTSATTTDERVALTLLRRSTTGSGGSAATEVPLDDGNTMTALAALTTLNTTQGTPGDVLKCWLWSQQGELLYLPTPELRPTVSLSAMLGLALGTAVGSSRTWSGWVAWEEFS